MTRDDGRWTDSEHKMPMVHDFGGEGPLVHLAHANGFPPGSYRQLAETLTDHHRVIALPSRALWPGSQPDSAPTWRPLADDMIQGLDTLRLRAIVGVGHSIGGVLTLWAATRRPDLFHAVVLIEPVILPPTWLWMLRLTRFFNLEHRLPLVRGALRRRQSWPSRQVCFEHYRSKPLFGRWSDKALMDYVESGTQERTDGQVELVYPPEWEAHIFGTTPVNIWRDVPKLQVPALVIRGEHSDTFRRSAQARMAHMLPDAQFVTIPNVGHLLPLEQPETTSAAIQSFLDEASVYD